jgi:hypothetical protein
MGITIYWVNKDWEIKSNLFDMIPLKESYSGLYMFIFIKKTLEKFGIESNILR